MSQEKNPRYAALQEIKKNIAADEKIIGEVKDTEYGYSAVVEFPSPRDMAKNTRVRRFYSLEGKHVSSEPV